MKFCTACREDKPLGEFFPRAGHPGKYLAQCKSCRATRYKEQYRSDEQFRAARIGSATLSTRERRKRPEVREQERVAAREAKRRLLSTPEGREHHNALGREWRRENPEKAKQFKHEHPAMKRMRTSHRRAAVLRATPSWADLDAIEAIYRKADEISRATGIPHEVDHHYPLCGKTSCGLHVPWNLRIITADENRRKANKLPDDALLLTAA